MTHTTKNYSTDGGDTLVIGGKLVVEDGATVEGLEGGGGGGAVAWDDIEDVPAPLTEAQAAGTASIRAIGTSGTTVAAGNHTHSFASLLGSIDNATGENLQAILTDIASRLAAVEAG